MKEVVEKLWELQGVMSHLREQEAKLNEKPESFVEVDAEYQASLAQSQTLEQKLDDLGKSRRKAEGELQDSQELLKKYQGQLMQVKNQAQYSAALKETDATRKRVKELEDGLLAQMTEVDETQQKLDDMKGGFDELKERWQASYDEWQHSLRDIRTDIEKTKKKAGTIETAIPPKLRAEFHRIFNHRQNIAVSEVVNNTCTACRTRVRPQALQQLKRGELVTCESCHRFVYLAGVNA